MEFKFINFRELALKDLRGGLREHDGSPLILIKKSGEIVFASGRVDKDTLISRAETGDALLFAWHGIYRTDAFVVNLEDMPNVYKTADFENYLRRLSAGSPATR